MKKDNIHIKLFFLLVFLLLLFFVINICLGSVLIPLKDVLSILIGDQLVKDSWHYIIINYRIPKAIVAVLVGGGLGISGLLMQTLFRNPLAGPYVLGLSSGASLGVAITILGASFLGGAIGTFLIYKSSLVIASSLGSLLVLLAVLIVSSKVKDTMAILIIGLMFSSITSALVGLLSYFSSAEDLQRYVFWGMGSLGNLSWNEVLFLFVTFSIGILFAILSVKPLNLFLLGDNYAKSLGLNIKKHRFIIILATSILAGSVTAFVGPIAFVGLAIPHLAKLFFNTSNHKILIPAVVLFGAILMLLCDCISQLPMSDFILPINAITSLFGAPVVIWLLLRKKKLFV